jgi:tryptophan halogenase
MAIKFVGWRQDGNHFYHPFQRFPDVKGIPLPEWWLRTRREGQAFDYSCFNVPQLCDTSRSPLNWDGRVFEDGTTYIRYAYHFDAGLLAKYLQQVGVARGVTHVYGDVGQVDRGLSGDIRSVQLADGRSLQADLFIDATGFRGLLINQVLGEPFQSFSRSLFCDRAVAMRIPMAGPEINPYTTATALSSGWVWDIPLSERVGTGYVYSSSFLDRENAEREFRRHLGQRAKDVGAFHIDMRVGRCRNSWVKNCVGVGLSSGFVEPLESTGIFFIQHALAELINHFPDRNFDETVIRSYNRAVARCIDGVRDFLILHYWVGDRSDSEFWRAVTSDLEVPDGLREHLELWQNRLPSPSSINPFYHGFAPYSYCVMLLGLGYEPRASAPILEYFKENEAEAVFHSIKDRSLQLVATLPSHSEYLRVVYGDRKPVKSEVRLS